MNAPSLHPPNVVRGFSIVELLLSVTILSLIIALLADMIVRTQNTMAQATSHVTEFQEARSALDTMSSTLSQAVMDAHWSYKRNASNGNPEGYEKASAHHFIAGPASQLLPSGAEAGQVVFFQAPLGFAGTFTDNPSSPTESMNLERLSSLVNCWGFYIQYGSDMADRPDFLQTAQAELVNPERKRFRLMQYSQPAEESQLYSQELSLDYAASQQAALRWFQDDLAEYSRPVADNILALILVPYSTNVSMISDNTGFSDTKVEPDDNYGYDSRSYQWEGTATVENISRRHQLPPKVQITLIAAEERAYDRFVATQGGNDDSAAAKIREVFQGKFEDFDKHQDDLASVEEELSECGLHFKMLTTTVTLRAGKWISEIAP